MFTVMISYTVRDSKGEVIGTRTYTEQNVFVLGLGKHIDAVINHIYNEYDRDGLIVSFGDVKAVRDDVF